MTAPAPLSGGDARTQLAEALNDVGLGVCHLCGAEEDL